MHSEIAITPTEKKDSEGQGSTPRTCRKSTKFVVQENLANLAMVVFLLNLGYLTAML